jgi:hypothetical protein
MHGSCYKRIGSLQAFQSHVDKSQSDCNSDAIDKSSSSSSSSQAISDDNHSAHSNKTKQVAQYLALYFCDPQEAASSELDMRVSGIKKNILECEHGRHIMAQLLAFIKSENILYESFKLACENRTIDDAPEYRLILSAGVKPSLAFTGAYNMPTSDQIAAVVPVRQVGAASTSTRDLILCLHDGSVQFISDMHQFYDALHYVLMFPHGDRGWHEELKRDGISENDFAAYRLQYRTDESCSDCKFDNDINKAIGERPMHSNTVLAAGRLTQ